MIGSSAAWTDSPRAASSAAWIPPASGSMSTARSSGTSPRRCSWLSWATNSGAQPPPVDEQNPVWMPGFESPGDEVAVIVAVARGGAVERQGEATSGMTEHRLDRHPGAVVELADDLVARHEGNETTSSK